MCPVADGDAVGFCEAPVVGVGFACPSGAAPDILAVDDDAEVSCGDIVVGEEECEVVGGGGRGGFIPELEGAGGGDEVGGGEGVELIVDAVKA